MSTDNKSWVVSRSLGWKLERMKSFGNESQAF